MQYVNIWIKLYQHIFNQIYVIYVYIIYKYNIYVYKIYIRLVNPDLLAMSEYISGSVTTTRHHMNTICPHNWRWWIIIMFIPRVAHPCWAWQLLDVWKKCLQNAPQIVICQNGHEIINLNTANDLRLSVSNTSRDGTNTNKHGIWRIFVLRACEPAIHIDGSHPSWKWQKVDSWLQWN